MKKLIPLLFLAILAINVSAQTTFEVDGIKYKTTSDTTVEVIAKTPEYEGDVVIPEQVSYNDTTYSVTSIEGWAFWVCENLTFINIPNSVTSIGNNAFGYCNSLTSITIPNSVTSIENYAFYGCKSLISVTIPNSVTSIENYAFYYCKSLTSITIPNSVTSIGASTFSLCESLTSIIIPNSVTSIGESVFYGCIGLTSVTIPNSITTIATKAFRNCSSLISVTIPNSVTTITAEAFRNCSSLTSISIPNSVTLIGDWAFCSCESLTSINCNALIPPILGSYVFYGVPKTIPLYVPARSVDAYKQAEQWNDFPNIFGIRFISEDKTICKGQSIQLYVMNADSYEWSNGMQGDIITVRPTVTTKYYVTGTYNDTTFLDSITINVINKDAILSKDIKISKSRLLCKDTPFELSVDSGYIYEWSNGSNTYNLYEIATISGSYYVTVTDTITCSYAMESIYIKVIDDCSVNGQVFYDINQNQEFDYFEKGLKDIKIRIDSNIYAITDNYGKFISNPLKTDCEVTIDLGEDSMWELSTIPATYNLNFIDTGINTNVLFGIRPKKLYKDFQLNIFSDIHRNGRPVNHYVSVKNKGTVEGKTTVEYSFDPNILTFDSCNNCENLSINGGLISFDTDTIAINDSRQYTLVFTVKVGSTGQKVFTYACIDNSYFGQLEMKNMNIKNNCDTLAPTVIASCDPNDKQVQWVGMNADKKYINNDDKTLRYTIRFQNTGNDTAFNIWLADTLSNFHDFSTLELLASSHDVVTLLDSNGVLKFFFYDILLPDSNVSEPLSHGFVSFVISLKDDIAECSEIKNKAGIFFDFNDPVITNEVVSTYSTLVAGISSDITINEGDSAIITANGGTNYLWSNNKTEQSITIKPISNTTYTVTVSDQYGCFQTAESIVSVITSIEKLSILNSKFSINIFPNPANDILNITKTTSNAKNLTVDIYDIYGKLIMKEQLTDNLQLDIKHLESGICFIKIENQTLKFIKQ
ncbi:MAG: hypothetical protein A2X12_09940 [Bacteroidetes bacterium GWE2_29_8]|nr:MAG: hypothetical protein A2X12_09940 [Bacteroidetes bacterium GWE2_29_8]